MNRKAIEAAIQVMKRVPANLVNLSVWQDIDYILEPHETEAEAVSCGTSACFAGWLAISPEFRGILRAEDCGVPYHMESGRPGSEAIAETLGISYDISARLCGMRAPMDFYGKPAEDVTSAEVVRKLEEMLS